MIELDVLRGVAVLLVLLRHSEGLVTGMGEGTRRVFEILARGGWIGVDLFFVLSGFLVSGLVFRELDAGGRLRVGRFWLRRAFKILPSFWFYLLFVVWVTAWREGSVPWGRWGIEMLFLQNYLPGLAGQTWSLAVEEHFYWILPLGLGVMYRRGGYRALPWVFLVICGVALGLRGWTAGALEYGHRTHLYPTHLRLDALCCGVILRHFHQHASATWRRCLDKMGVWSWPLVVVLLVPAFLIPLGSSRALTVFGLSGNFLGFGLLISLVLRQGVPTEGIGEMWVRALAKVGTWSYGIYLWHLEILGRLEHYGMGKLPAELLWVLGLGASVALGALVTRWIECPVLRLRDRYFPGSTP